MTAVVCARCHRRAAPAPAIAGMLAIRVARSVAAQENSPGPSESAGARDDPGPPNVYVIFGAGANVRARRPDGLVPRRYAVGRHGRQGPAGVKAISPKPIRLIVNTSADADHVGGNGVLGDAGVSLSPIRFSQESHATVLAHENVLLQMSAPTGRRSPFPTNSWPNETFTSRFRPCYVNDERVQVIRQTGAHSDADAMALFRTADVDRHRRRRRSAAVSRHRSGARRQHPGRARRR
jgi:glyoxylase-like metal-dependent hydrolase (beta-lactamase superfamily II)